MQLISCIRQTSRAVVRELGLVGPTPSCGGVTPSQGHALLELAAGGPLLVAEIADRLRLDKSSASRVVTHLEAQGFVAPEPRPDQRCKAVALTPAGREVVRAIDEQANRQVQAALEQLSAEERAAVARGMELYAQGLVRARARGACEVRRIRAEDDAALAGVIRAVRASFGPFEASFEQDDPELASVSAAYAGPAHAFFVATRDGRVVGGAGIGPLASGGSRLCELRKMYVLPEGRGFGLGRELARRCLDAARAAGYETCYLETLKRMDAARSLYLSLGFTPLAGAPRDSGHSGCDAWFERRL